ncbi:MAG TPA: NIPSNAP family protein [bacterium]|nr:NIPSNAP family protein [bacterium]HPN42167.1 NIPSNAP family protein [bacterium]
MKRRDFIAATVALGAAPVLAVQQEANNKEQREYIELIKYRLPVGDKKGLVADFYKNAAIPAMNRNGIDRVGVFSVMYGPNDPSLWVLIPHKSLESVITLQDRLLDDKDYVQAGAEFLNTPLSAPAFIRMESSLLRAFTALPQVEAPVNLLENKGRIYELRIYESHSRKYAQKKIDMFNDGEIAVFKKTGLQPVFFGETIIGPMMPNLTYMLVFDSMTGRDQNWAGFVKHPEWIAMRDDPQYKDTVSNITDIILRPEPFSQL